MKDPIIINSRGRTRKSNPPFNADSIADALRILVKYAEMLEGSK